MDSDSQDLPSDSDNQDLPRVRNVKRLWLEIGVIVLIVAAIGFGVYQFTRSDDDNVAADTETVEPATLSSCSAQTLISETVARDNISAEAEAKRIAIIDAALACDLDALKTLAEFDGAAELIVDWEAQELAGEEPLMRLVLLLRGSLSTIARDEIEYRFPSAAGFDTWADVPASVRENLLAIYGEEQVFEFDVAGVYTGDVTALNDAGAWMYFTPGDY